MYKPDTHTKSPARGATVDCCTDLPCESGLKNNFFAGKRLTPDMFSLEQRYLVERRRLLNRAIHGWGVVYGYAVGVEPAPRHKAASTRKLNITTGLALDECGRELMQAGTRHLVFGDLIMLDKDGKRIDPDVTLAAIQQSRYNQDLDAPPLCWVLKVHYAEALTDPVSVPASCRCDHGEWDHTCETVRYTLTQLPCDDCCREVGCELAGDCKSGPCCGPEADDEARTFTRGGCQCLCHHLTGLDPGGDCSGRLCEIEEPCGRVRVDLGRGVPLACLELRQDECDDWTFGEDLDACGPRRLVKRNDLLFDLIRGCDLTRISEIGWAPLHRKDEVPFDDFSDAFGPGEHGKPEYITRDFWVKFTRPVRKDTLRPDCFAITILTGETHDYWWDVYRVPIKRLDPIPPEPDDPPDHVRGARLVIDGRWVHGALRGESRIFSYDTTVEIEVRGDFIVDCNGQTVDANAIGLSTARTGNGTPGGTFLSVFRVAPRGPSKRSVPYDPADRKGASS